MSKASKKPIMTLKVSKDLINGNSVHLYIEDIETSRDGEMVLNKVIVLNGMIGERELQSLLTGRILRGNFILKKVSDEQTDSLIEQMAEILKSNTIGESGRMLFTNLVYSISDRRLKAIIIFRNTIFSINSISVYQEEDGANRIVFWTV